MAKTAYFCWLFGLLATPDCFYEVNTDKHLKIKIHYVLWRPAIHFDFIHIPLKVAFLTKPLSSLMAELQFSTSSVYLSRSWCPVSIWPRWSYERGFCEFLDQEFMKCPLLTSVHCSLGVRGPAVAADDPASSYCSSFLTFAPLLPMLA